MIDIRRCKFWVLAFMLMLTSQVVFSACINDNKTTTEMVTAIADKVWAFSQNHPDGFTLDIRTMTEPTEGVAASFLFTQGSHSREQLDKVVAHALEHEGYVGGWYNTDNGLYYFDSSCIFPESALEDAIKFGKENRQNSVYIISLNAEVPLAGKVAAIIERGRVLVGTTGDYRPLSFCESDAHVEGEDRYWGFCIEVAKEVSRVLGVEIEFVPTSWPTLSADVLTRPQKFDFAIGGITITDARKESMLMSEGYLANGKTILCRASDSNRFKSLADVDSESVRVMVNPGGLNQKFANENLHNCTILVNDRNEDIPSLIAENQADVMITEITEAPYYVKDDSRLAAPLLSVPFTHGQIGVLMAEGQEDLLGLINGVICRMKTDGSLRQFHDKYGFIYSY